MYDINQFRPTLMALLLLGFTGFAVAAETPGIWLISVAGVLLNIWLYRNNRFRPLPRYVANGITLLFALWLVLRVRAVAGPPILAIGEFLVFLQLVKLFEQRGNRDLAQLLILSLLLMVAAAISTASLLFGLMFVAYLFLSLYCCLLFHLKTETDHAKAALGVDESKINPTTLRQDQRFLTRSMRRLTGLVSTFAVIMAMLVFLFFPRGTGAGVIGNLAFRPQQAMTGFSDSVSFQDVARITQNEAEVAYVTVTKNGRPWGAGQTLYLRGSAPDTYVSDPNDADRWKWIRTTATAQQSDVIPTISGGQDYPLSTPPDDSDRYTQNIRLLPIGSNTIFAMPGLVSFRPSRDMRLSRGLADDVLQVQEPVNNELNYTVVSTNAATIPTDRPSRESLADRTIRMATPSRNDTPRTYPVPAEIKAFAVRDDVCGTDARGNLAQQRLKLNQISPLDEAIAKNFEHYLQTNYKYTLDLTDVNLVKDKDPLVQFLTDFKKGHCEYFAGAMALMCQSIGMKARVVVGFKCDEFNTLGSYFLVKQSHAHAWTEVLTPAGWEQFDPTTSNEAGGGAKAQSLWKQFRNVLSYLEYTWGNKVVNYDSESRTNLIQNVDTTLTNTAIHSTDWFSWLRDQLDLQNFFLVSSGLLTMLVCGMTLIIVASVLYFLLERIRLRRRARRIGLGDLPGTDLRRLARQLAFYDAMVRALERRKIVRAAHLTPLEFSRSIEFLPGEIFQVVQRLTRVFYRVRYGGADLQPPQQRRLERVVERLDAALGPAKA